METLDDQGWSRFYTQPTCHPERRDQDHQVSQRSKRFVLKRCQRCIKIQNPPPFNHYQLKQLSLQLPVLSMVRSMKVVTRSDQQASQDKVLTDGWQKSPVGGIIVSVQALGWLSWEFSRMDTFSQSMSVGQTALPILQTGNGGSPQGSELPSQLSS